MKNNVKLRLGLVALVAVCFSGTVWTGSFEGSEQAQNLIKDMKKAFVALFKFEGELLTFKSPLIPLTKIELKNRLELLSTYTSDFIKHLQKYHDLGPLPAKLVQNRIDLINFYKSFYLNELASWRTEIFKVAEPEIKAYYENKSSPFLQQALELPDDSFLVVFHKATETVSNLYATIFDNKIYNTTGTIIDKMKLQELNSSLKRIVNSSINMVKRYNDLQKIWAEENKK
jgi:hypothetical protein